MKVYYKQVQLNPITETDYTNLLDKPQINSVELMGELSTEQIKVTWFGTQSEFDALGTYSPTTLYIIDDGVPVNEGLTFLDLANKPSINGQVLTGKKLASDLNMYTTEEIQAKLAALRSVKVDTALPATPLANTMYYIGNATDGYTVYLFDSFLNRIDLGPLIQRVYTSNGDPLEIDNHNNVISLKIDDDTLGVDINNKLEMVKATVRDRLYPVGSIFMSATHNTAESVATAMGGTWVAWGAGKVPVGVNTSDNDFKTVEKTGGEKTHKLTINEMAAHTHSARLYSYGAGGSWCLNNQEVNYTWSDAYVGYAGGDAAHNNLQPYIVCYMYKRTA